MSACLYAYVYNSVSLPANISADRHIEGRTLTVCVRVSASVCLPVCLPVCLSLCLSVCLSICLCICLSVYISARLSICMSIYMYVSLSVFLSICLSFFCLFFCLYLRSVCLYLSSAHPQYLQQSIYLNQAIRHQSPAKQPKRKSDNQSIISN